MKFRKKPIVIEAIQFTGDLGNRLECLNFDGGIVWGCGPGVDPCPGHLYIGTLEGEMRADAGDWIIRGVKGEVYPCKPDIFAVTYEAVD